MKLPRNVERSYLANLQKVCPLIEAGRNRMAIRLLEAFIRQVRQDIRRRFISPVAGKTLVDMAMELINEISGH